ncbi:MAG: lipocalin-like domain-containing protein [Paracoccaceae bacterium]
MLCWISALFMGTVAGTLVQAQGFAGLGTEATGFDIPERGTELVFPRDHGPHPEFRIEWWYLTANLQDQDGQEYGVQWTLFRSALAPNEAQGWQSPQLWMGHAGLTTPDRHFQAERLARGGIGQAGVTAAPFAAWIDNWEMTSDSGEELEHLRLTANGSEFSYELKLNSDGPLVLHGDDGYSVKSAEGQASYYYSQPAYQISGVLSVSGQEIRVTGQGWLDREWSSQPLGANQTGWDWFSLSFGTGEKMMAFRLRDHGDGYASGTWITAEGTAYALEPNVVEVTELSHASVAGRDIPVHWALSLPERGVNVTVTALNPDAWMETSFPYWEGPVRVSGSHTGRGYLEMTGYE